MSVMSNFTPFCDIGSGIKFADAKLNCRSLACTNSRAGIRLTKPFEDESFRISRIAFRSSSRVSRRGSARMALVDERLARVRNVIEPPRILAYELVQGALFLLVYLRCHGDSASIKKRGPHSVASTALDVLKLFGQLRITP